MTGLERLQPWLVPYATWLYQVAVQYGLRPRVTSTLRTYDEQLALYQHNPSGLPAARPGTSKHEAGLAFDLVVSAGRNSPEQAWLGQVWQSVGGKWLGSYDPVHFEVP